MIGAPSFIYMGVYCPTLGSTILKGDNKAALLIVENFADKSENATEGQGVEK